MSNSLSLATTSMVRSTATSSGNGTTTASNTTESDSCHVPADNSSVSPVKDKEGEFDWDELTQSYVNNAATYGTLLTIMIGARIADWWSPKKVLVLISILYTVVYMLTPVLARWSVYALISSRALYGLLMGPSRPATNALDAAWYPPVERQLLCGIVVSGTLVLFFTYDSPMDHPRISEAEKEYIVTSTKKERKSGYVSSLPHAATWFGQLFFGFVARWIRKTGYINQLTQYRIFNALAMFGPAATLVAITQSGCNTTLIVALLVATTGLQSAYLTGSLLNHMDLAINLVPTLNGISETITSITGIVSPTVAAALINKQETLTAWSKIFYISAAFSALPYAVFLVFGSADEQPWNKPRRKEAEHVEKEERVDCVLEGGETQAGNGEQKTTTG
ncbi:hypothetical protein PR048_026420 [Dryococelus australis]|uniref:Inorganic phosphate cotransporter n=1 Tax=Dryococelus australis TaxID=614101 RepID=A0ABQ9GLB2_9NEOP|nr:hypothetical protein PR048_026420 [Dryococelus australis]